MSRLQAANNAQTALAALMDATATTCTVVNGDILPTVPFRVTVDSEIMEVGAKAGNTLSSILRAQEGTVAAAHVSGSIVENKWTAGMHNELITASGILSTVLTGLSTATNAVITAADTILAALGKLQAQITSHKTDTAAHGCVLRQAIINGGFAINQRVVSGTVTLAAGAYGHDRWKAGASGCTYTFATSANVTTITITAGSLLQIIEGNNLFDGTYTLSWAGTAQGKIGAGSYGSSGITGSVTGGSNLTIEFNTGTLSKVQFNFGTTALPFSPKSFDQELQACQRYYEKSYSYSLPPGFNFGFTLNLHGLNTNLGNGYSGALYYYGIAANAVRKHSPIISYKVRKRLVAPTMQYWDVAGNLSKITEISSDGVYVTNNVAETYQGVVSTDSVLWIQSGANVAGFCLCWAADAEL